MAHRVLGDAPRAAAALRRRPRGVLARRRRHLPPAATPWTPHDAAAKRGGGAQRLRGATSPGIRRTQDIAVALGDAATGAVSTRAAVARSSAT
jgi:hypothetical protein